MGSDELRLKASALQRIGGCALPLLWSRIHVRTDSPPLEKSCRFSIARPGSFPSALNTNLQQSPSPTRDCPPSSKPSNFSPLDRLSIAIYRYSPGGKHGAFPP